MKNLLLLILATVLTLFKVSMADDLEDYVNKGHVEILVEALKYSDAGMFEEAANEIKNTNNENLIVFMKWLKLREGEGTFSEYTDFLKFHEHWPQTRLLKKLAENFPEHKSWIGNMLERIVDLATPFRSFYYYKPSQKGSYSLKKVLPAVTGKDYSELEISNGGDASMQFFYSHKR